MNSYLNITNTVDKIKSLNIKKLINYFIVLLAFLIPISKAGTSFAEMVLILLWLMNADFKNKFCSLKQSKIILVLFVLVGFSALSIVWSNDKVFAISYVAKYWHFIVILVIYTSLQRKYIEYIFSAFLLAMFISEITSYGIFFELWTYKNISPSDPSPFMNHTDYSSYLAFTIFILLYRIKLETTLQWKIIYGLYFSSSLSNLFINGGRTGQVIFLVSIFVFAFLNVKNKIKAFFYSVVISTILFLFAYSVSPVFETRINYLKQDFTEMIYQDNYTNSFSIRVALWIIGAKAFISEPFFGTGIGDEAILTKNEIVKIGLSDFIVTNGIFCQVDYHNNFIQYIVQLGIFGFVLMLLLFYYLIKLKVKTIPYADLKIFFITVYFLWSVIGHTLHLHDSMLFFVLFVSIFMVIDRHHSLGDS